MLKPQDCIILLKIALVKPGDHPQQQDIAQALKMSQAEISLSLKRCAESGLYDPQEKRVMPQNLLELLQHGIKYFFPPQFKGQGRGIKTAWAAMPLSKNILASDINLMPVWAHPEGDTLGQILVPIYPTVPDAALMDPKLYEVLSLLEALRMGRVREKSIALAELKKRI